MGELRCSSSAHTHSTQQHTGRSALLALLPNARVAAIMIKRAGQLIEASRRGLVDDVLILLSYPHELSPDETNANGRTALMAAAQGNHHSCATALLNKGAAINLADENGNTALHVAAINGHSTMVTLLIRRRANIDALTSRAKTPFSLALATGAHEAARILACSGCTVPSGSSQMQEFRDHAKFMDRRARWLKTKQVLALLDMLERTPRSQWTEAFRLEWPNTLRDLQTAQIAQEEEDHVIDEGIANMVSARKAAKQLLEAREQRRQRQEREVEERAAEAERERLEEQRRFERAVSTTSRQLCARVGVEHAVLVLAHSWSRKRRRPRRQLGRRRRPTSER
eukprot:COSAG01_NODE_238_length_20679_cov_140.041399_3_plen_340_part_00